VAKLRIAMEVEATSRMAPFLGRARGYTGNRIGTRLYTHLSWQGPA
jgi:hypothetical protein